MRFPTIRVCQTIYVTVRPGEKTALFPPVHEPHYPVIGRITNSCHSDTP